MGSIKYGREGKVWDYPEECEILLHFCLTFPYVLQHRRKHNRLKGAIDLSIKRQF